MDTQPVQQNVPSTAAGRRPRSLLRRFGGLRLRAALAVLPALLVVLSLGTWLDYRAQRDNVLREAQRQGESLAGFLGQAISQTLAGRDHLTVTRLVQGLSSHPDIVHAQVTGAQGEMLAEYGKPPMRDDVVLFRRELRGNDERLGELQLTLDTGERTRQLASRAVSAAMWVILGAALIATVVYAALTVTVVRPLRAMTRALRRGDAKGTSAPLPVPAHGELAQLALAVNAQRERSDVRQRRLHAQAGTASAELKRAAGALTQQSEELSRRNHDLQLLAATDPLTGLYNQRYFHGLMRNEIGPAIFREETQSILLIEIDGLADHRERLGPATADAIVREVAHRLAAHVRRADVLCRLDNGRFFLLGRGATMANAITIADHLQQSATREPLELGGQRLPLGLSVGIATMPGRQPVRSAEEFLRCAETALAHSREYGHDGIAHYAMLEALRVAPASA